MYYYGGTLAALAPHALRLKGPSSLLQSSTKHVITPAEWEQCLDAVKIRKEYMNGLVMDFLVTEVRFVLTQK